MNKEDIAKVVTEENVAELEKFFQKYGVRFQDENGNYRSTYDILTDIAKVFPFDNNKSK